MQNQTYIHNAMLLTKREAGRELGVSERTVHELLKAGHVPFVRFGGNVRIARSDLVTFIERQRTAATMQSVAANAVGGPQPMASV